MLFATMLSNIVAKNECVGVPCSTEMFLITIVYPQAKDKERS